MPVVLVSYYVLGLPLGALLAFRYAWGARGIVVGLFVGKMTHFLLYGVLVLRTDWRQQVVDAARRVSSERPTEAAIDGSCHRSERPMGAACEGREKAVEEEGGGVEATSQTRERAEAEAGGTVGGAAGAEKAAAPVEKAARRGGARAYAHLDEES